MSRGKYNTILLFHEGGILIKRKGGGGGGGGDSTHSMIMTAEPLSEPLIYRGTKMRYSDTITNQFQFSGKIFTVSCYHNSSNYTHVF